MAAKKYAQLILHSLRLNLHLAHGPAIHVPAEIDHAVLFQKIIVELVGGNETFIVRGLVIDLNGNPTSTVFQHEVSIAAVLVNVIKMIL